MTAAQKLNLVAVEDYLAGELVSELKHEYVAGVVYAMAGARISHNLIAGNFFGTLYGILKESSCKPYNSDTKVRILLPTHPRFYYPDGMIVCESNPQDASYQDNPVVIAEVLSKKTRRIDQGEKLDAYITIPSLKVYLLIEQEKPKVLVYRRTDSGFVPEVYSGLDAVIPLGEIETELPLAELYNDVNFTPEPEDED